VNELSLGDVARKLAGTVGTVRLALVASALRVQTLTHLHASHRR
jgi:hypothetical protein